MSLTKVDYTDYQTVIGAANLNAIQDEIILRCNTVEQKTFSDSQKAQARTNIGAVSSTDVNTAVTTAKPLVVSGTISDSNRIISNSAITATMVVVHSVIANPAVQTGDWTVTTAAGSATITGNLSGSTTVTLYLEEPR